MISVFLLDSEAVARRHLAALLSLCPDMVVVGHGNGRISPTELAALQPDAIVVGTYDRQLLLELRMACPHAGLVAWADRTQPELIAGFASAGIHAVVDRAGDIEPLLAALRKGTPGAAAKAATNGQPVLPRAYES